jgi:large subunit ribosomal protein L29
VKAAELRSKDTDQLRKQLAETSKELMQLRFQKATGALEKRGELARVKRDVARIRTVLGEQRRAAAPSAAPAAAAAPAATAPESTTEEG